MGIGTSIRHRLGALELPAANLYRSAFINIADLAATLASIVTPGSVLEIGCGDGTFANELLAVFPSASYLGIDIAPTPGRLFRGPRDHVQFRSMATGELLEEDRLPFDLVVIVDVLHHVPGDQRVELLEHAARLTAADGLLAIKDWERGRNLGHGLVYVADRYVSGDRGVAFPARDELESLVDSALPEFGRVVEARIPPWRNNVLIVMGRNAPRA